MSIVLVMPSNHLILCCPLLLLPSIFPSIRVFSSEPALCIRWPKYWSFSFNISPSNEHPGLICFRMDWLDLLAVQGNLKSPLQHHSSKASILLHSTFFIVQLSHPYMTTGSFTFSEINSLPHCFLYCGMTFLLLHFQEHGKEILSNTATAFTVDRIILFHRSPLTEIFGLLSSLTKKDIMYKYMTATVTRSVPRAPQVTGWR